MPPPLLTANANSLPRPSRTTADVSPGVILGEPLTPSTATHPHHHPRRSPSPPPHAVTRLKDDVSTRSATTPEDYPMDEPAQPRGISLVFKRPVLGMDDVASAGGGGASATASRASSPAAPPGGGGGGSGKKKRRADPLSTNQSSPAPAPNPLAIFAPPPPSSLPAALQSSVAARDGDEMLRDAADGFARSRLRPSRTRGDSGIRSGVSARGEGVKVGGSSEKKSAAGGASGGSAGAAAATASAAASGGGKKGKGKGRMELDVPNQDFCSACRGIGRFLCCDGCPRSFHFMCLEPPLRIDELPDEETWYCKKCRTERSKDSSSSSASPSKLDKELKPIPLVFKQLCKRLDEENPTQFRLPQDIRQYFSGVSTGLGGGYVDAEEARTKYDRKGFQEDRDSLRQRDARSRPIACYVCGGSSFPSRTLTTDPESSWRQIVSCDYCALHWHLDCLEPPLASMPNAGRKWMCPNHAELVMPRRRTVRNGLETVDVFSQDTPNNGNIVIIPDDDGKQRVPLDYEDMIINKRKYRVPEKIIRLDFWEKLGLGGGRKAKPPAKIGDKAFHPGRKRKGSGSSSLTSLSSRSEEGDKHKSAQPSSDDLEAANLLFGLLAGGGQGNNGHILPVEGQANGTTTHAGEKKRDIDQVDHAGVSDGQNGGAGSVKKIMLRVGRSGAGAAEQLANGNGVA